MIIKYRGTTTNVPMENCDIEKTHFDSKSRLEKPGFNEESRSPCSSYYESDNPERLNRALRWTRCLGLATTFVLLITIPFNLAILGFLSFLWHADKSNAFWHIITIRNWAARAVTVSSLFLRSLGDLQAGAASAMIAALVCGDTSLEQYLYFR